MTVEDVELGAKRNNCLLYDTLGDSEGMIAFRWTSLVVVIGFWIMELEEACSWIFPPWVYYPSHCFP